MQRTKFHKVTAAVIAVVVLAGGLILLFRDKKTTQNPGPVQEFTDLKVVQYYLHMPGRDYIIGRKEKSYEKISSAAKEAACSVSGSLPVRPESIQEIEAKGLSLSIWLLQPQKISTKIKGKGGNTDKYGNTVLVTDRILLVLSGKYQGKCFTRDSQSGQWQGWDLNQAGMGRLVEIVRNGGL